LRKYVLTGSFKKNDGQIVRCFTVTKKDLDEQHAWNDLSLSLAVTTDTENLWRTFTRRLQVYFQKYTGNNPVTWDYCNGRKSPKGKRTVYYDPSGTFPDFPTHFRVSAITIHGEKAAKGRDGGDEVATKKRKSVAKQSTAEEHLVLQVTINDTADCLY